MYFRGLKNYWFCRYAVCKVLFHVIDNVFEKIPNDYKVIALDVTLLGYPVYWYFRLAEVYRVEPHLTGLHFEDSARTAHKSCPQVKTSLILISYKNAF
jgi:hypothetical protein